MSTTRDEFLRRYATSPIHVPRLERLLLAYGGGDDGESFARQFIEWDRECRDGEAARIVSEIISTCVDESGRIKRLSDDVVAAAITWMAEATSYSIAERAKLLEQRLQI